MDVDVIGVPYHPDEYLPELDLPLRPGAVITADLPAGDTWERLAFLYSRVARAVAERAGRDAGPVLVSGACTTALGAVAGLQRAGADPGIVCTWYPGHAAAQRVAPHLEAALAGAGWRA